MDIEATIEAVGLLTEQRRQFLNTNPVVWGILCRAGLKLEAEARKALTGPAVDAHCSEHDAASVGGRCTADLGAFESEGGK